MPRKPALVVIAFFVLLFAFPGTASAHAVLVGTTPEGWQVVDTSPKAVTLRFNEPVDAALADVRLLGPRGDEIAGIGRPEHPAGQPSELSVAIPNTLANGTHTVAYQVVSADSHPVQGAFTFSVGAASGGAAPNALPAASSGGSLSIVYAIFRWVTYAALALLVGTAFFATVCWPGGGTRTGVRRLLQAGWMALVVSTLGILVIYSPYATGRPLSSALSLLGPTLASRLGVMLLIRLALLGLVAAASVSFLRRLPDPPAPMPAPARRPALAGARAGGSARSVPSLPPAPEESVSDNVPSEGGWRGRLPGAAVITFGMLLGFTWSLADHAATGPLVPLALIADAAHLTAMSVWIGGLVVLAAIMLRSGDVLGMRAAVPRFSRTALICVCVLVATGLFQAWRQTRTLEALTGTTYGRLLLVKTGMVALVTGFAWLARRWVRTHYGFRVVSVSDKRRARRGPPPAELRRFRQAVAAETVLAVVVLGVTSALVSVEPANAQLTREATAARPPAVTGPVNVVVPFAAGGVNGSGQLGVTVLPGKVGPNQVHLSILDAQFQPRDVAEVRAELRLPERNLGPLTVSLDYDGAGHYIAENASLPMPGRWELSVTVRTSETDQAVVRIPVGAR
jgi:copper transport protein